MSGFKSQFGKGRREGLAYNAPTMIGTAIQHAE